MKNFVNDFKQLDDGQKTKILVGGVVLTAFVAQAIAIQQLKINMHFLSQALDSHNKVFEILINNTKF